MWPWHQKAVNMQIVLLNYWDIILKYQGVLQVNILSQKGLESLHYLISNTFAEIVSTASEWCNMTKQEHLHSRLYFHLVLSSISSALSRHNVALKYTWTLVEAYSFVKFCKKYMLIIMWTLVINEHQKK